MAKFLKDKKFLPVNSLKTILLIGCGGTGSILAEHICRMISGFKLECSLVLCDGDTVKDANITRQNFAAWEIGANKAQALAMRLSGQFGIEVGFAAKFLKADDMAYPAGNLSLVITATDSLQSRRIVANGKWSYWLDVGNELNHGQAVFGTAHNSQSLKSAYKSWQKYAHALELPDIAALNPRILKARKTPQKASCADQPFAEQGFGVNALAALAAATLVRQAAVDRKVKFAAIYFDIAKGRMAPRLIDKELFKQWRKNGE